MYHKIVDSFSISNNQILKYILIVLFISNIFTLNSQNVYTITGNIENEIDGPIPEATVYIMDTDSNFISISTSDSIGFFHIQYPVEIKGTLNVTHIIYDNHSIPLPNKSDYGIKITLNKNIYKIDEVVVQAKKPAFNMKDGNIIVKVSSIPGVSNMSSGKLLNRLSGVNESADGSYTLYGTSAVIYINGVRQNLTAKALKSYLDALPATAVSDVELLQTPPASYDSNVQAAINIVIDKKKENGVILNLEMFSGEQKGYLGNTGLDLFYMIKSDNILFNATLNYSNINLYKSGSDSTVYGNNINNPIRNDFRNSGRDNQLSLNSNLTINLKNNNNIDFNVFAYLGASNAIYQNNTSIYDLASTSNKHQKYKTDIDGYDDLYTLTAKYSSDPRKSFSYISYYNGLYGGIRTKEKYNFFEPSENWSEYMSSDIKMEGQMHSFTSDFINKISNVSLEYGVKIDYNIINDKATYKNSLAKIEDSRFKGNEIIPAIHAGINYSRNNKLTISAAMRSEYTNYDLNLKSSNSNTNDDYLIFFPKFTITYRSNPYTASLFYNSFIQRQNYMDLLPGERYVNEHYSSVGNPELKPILVDILGLHSIFLGGIFSVLVQYQNIKDEYEKVLIEKNSKTVESPLNYTDRSNWVLHINIPIILFKNRLSGNFSYTNIFFNKYKNINPNFIMPDGRNKNYKKANVDFKFQYEITELITIDYLFNYKPKYRSILYDRNSMWKMDFGISYSLPKNKKIILSADIKDIFDTYNDNRDIFFGNNYMHSEIKGNGPIFNISFKYKFNKGNNIRNEYKDSRPDISRLSK